MSRKSGGFWLGALVLAGAVLGVAKYLKDYCGASYIDEEEFQSARKSALRTKEAAKRTFVALKEKKDVQKAAGELCEAAGSAAADAGRMAATAGSGMVDAARELKTRFDEDPEGTRKEFLDNVSDIGDSLKQKSQFFASNLKEKFSAADETSDTDTGDIDIETPEEPSASSVSISDEQ